VIIGQSGVGGNSAASFIGFSCWGWERRRIRQTYAEDRTAAWQQLLGCGAGGECLWTGEIRHARLPASPDPSLICGVMRWRSGRSNPKKNKAELVSFGFDGVY